MNNVTYIRKSKGWTQEDLADLAQVTQPTVNRIEKGHDGVTLRTLRQIADALEVPLYAIFLDDMSIAELNLIKASRNLSPEQDALWREKAEQAKADPAPKDQ